MSFIEVGQIDQIPVGSMKSTSVSGKQILIANVDGEFYAINNTCTHAGGDLSKGKLEGKIVTCPRHGSKFDVTTGKCILGPKFGFLKINTKDATAFEVKAEENKILVAGA
ncbi:MAG: Rieske 2Fe-2S domain-containing protein [Coprothermobacterota bacterium]|jgi:3-phenylpropionate/trans-cinnamate dioxygenase ferredoxin subunit|nr:Rieske 2Fe-2S domain-containing protein [Coprothermobacterota bacterium]